jgi:anaerobic dimethyl sulfoxide reductase subunit B (iron-sulfur subunit)
MARQLAFYLDASTCAGCKACMVACKDKNDLPVGINWRKVVHYGGGGWTAMPGHGEMLQPNNVYAYAVSVACMHCQDAVCTEICPAGAMTKNADGIVTIDADKCIGCRYCEWACPYGAPQFDARAGVMTKCNMCADLLAQGQNPACVDACVMRALEVGELSELRAKYGVNAPIEPLPGEAFTRPAFVVTPHRHAQVSGTGTGRILGLPEEA